MNSFNAIGDEKKRKRRKMDPSLSADANRKAEIDARRERVEGKKNGGDARLLEGVINYCVLRDEEFGREIMRRFMEKYSFDGNHPFDEVAFRNVGLYEGSNPYFAAAINGIVRERGKRVATPVDIEAIRRTEELDFGTVYFDSALVLRSEEGMNEYLAKDLVKQFKEQEKEIFRREPLAEIAYPVMIPYSNLDLEVDVDAPDGFRFKLLDSEIVISSPTLNSNDLFSEIDLDTGLPLYFNLEGDRAFVGGGSGLCGLSIDETGIDAMVDDFTKSTIVGRVMIVGGNEK